MYSYHIFLFPFKWETNTNNAVSDNQVDYFNNLLIESGVWNRRKFDLNTYVSYNEYNYFYRQVRSIIYDKSDVLIEDNNCSNISSDTLDTSEFNDAKKLIFHYEYDISNIKMRYCIENRDKTYKLDIDKIILNVYKTGTAVLSFHLENNEYENPNDVLMINDLGRRLFPPFFLESDFSEYKLGGLADRIWLEKLDSTSVNMQEDYSRYNDPKYYEKGPFRIPNFIEYLFPNINLTTYSRDLFIQDNSKADIYIDTILDDRMFVISYLKNDDYANSIKEEEEYNVYNKTYKDFIYKYIFVDSDNITVQCEDMQKKLLRDSLYERWKGYSTLWGVSRYSFIGLVNSGAPSYLLTHLQTMYYRMIELSLVQRSSILNFSEEVACLSSEIVPNLSKKSKKDVKKSVGKARDLYNKFLQFKTLMCFAEVSPQEQGIEMYHLIQDRLNIPTELNILEGKMNDLHNYSNLIQQNVGNGIVENLTYIMLYLAVPTLFIGIFSMSLMPDNIPKYIVSFTSNVYWPFWIGLIMIGFLSILIIILVNKKILNKYE